ncbi:MAG: hypothetical protein IJJ01_01460 [Firmicutes bacterium]|nr:hypothetical protein [Bacillota bacterium]
MAWNKNGKERDKAAEKAVKTRLGNTHLKSVRIIGSEKDPESGVVTVHVLRMVGNDNYLFRVNCTAEGSGYAMSGLVPVTDWQEYGEYRVYNPKPASIEALRPTPKEKKFTGYSK